MNGKNTKKKMPGALALLICVAAVAFGVWNGTQNGSESRNPGGRQEAQTTQPSQSPQPSQDTRTQEQEIRYRFRTKEQLEDHYERHGVEMGYEDEQAYLAAANRVVESPDALHKLEAEDGDDVYYIEETNEFVVVSGDGYIRTYFYPDDGLAYYERQ